MKARKFFSMFMIAAAICTTGFMMTSCQDDDVVEMMKYSTVKVESSEVYQTKDAVDARITYNVDAEVSMSVNRTESEWVNLIRKEINKEINYVVGDMNFENLSTKIFDDIYESQNNKDYTIDVLFLKIEKEPVEDKWENINVKSSDTYSIANEKEVVIDYSVDVRMLSNVVIDEIKNLINKNITDGVKDISWSDESSFSASVKNILNNIPETDKYSFQNSEVTAELVKNETLYSVSIEGVTLNNVQTQDYYKFYNVKINSCNVEYDDLGTVNEDEIKNLIISKINTEYEKYMKSVWLSERYKEYCATHEENRERIANFLDSELSNFDTYITTVFNIENDNFVINTFETMKGLDKSYYIMWLKNTANEHGYMDSTVSDDYENY